MLGVWGYDAVNKEKVEAGQRLQVLLCKMSVTVPRQRVRRWFMQRRLGSASGLAVAAILCDQLSRPVTAATNRAERVMQAAGAGQRFRVWPAVRYLMCMRTFWLLTLAVGVLALG